MKEFEKMSGTKSGKMFPPYKVLSRSRLISDRSTVFNYVINILFGSN
jgi:hypothetical protein